MTSSAPRRTTASPWATPTNNATAVLASTDGGVTWRTKGFFPTGEFPGALACTSTDDCLAAGSRSINYVGRGAIFATTNGGADWRTEKLPTIVKSLAAISCSSASHCVAVGDGPRDPKVIGDPSLPIIVTTTNGGATWAAVEPPAGLQALGGVSCGSAEDCLAVGSGTGGTGAVLATTDGGTHWTVLTLPSSAGVVYAVSCRSALDCAAVGGAETPTLITTSTGGATWDVKTTHKGGSLDDVSCASTSDCLAVGNSNSNGVAYATMNGGSSWTSETVPRGQMLLNSVSCPATSDCAVVGATADNVGDAMATKNEGARWEAGTVPGGIADLRAVSCPSTSDCTAVGDFVGGDGAILSTRNGGATWQLKTAPGGVGLHSVSCPSTNDCVAVGRTDDNFSGGVGAIVATTNGGVTWRLKASFAGIWRLTGVSCASTRDCVAVGVDQAVFRRDLRDDQRRCHMEARACTGRPVSSLASLARRRPNAWLWRVDTPTSLSPRTADSDWKLTASSGGLRAVSCASTTDCVAVGSRGLVGAVFTTRHGGAKWAAKAVGTPSAYVALLGVSCASTTDCVAVGIRSGKTGVVVTTTNGGARWGVTTLRSAKLALEGVSVASPGYAQAVGSGLAGSVIIGERPAAAKSAQ